MCVCHYGVFFAHFAGAITNDPATFRCVCCEEYHTVNVCCCGKQARETPGVLDLDIQIYTCADGHGKRCTYCVQCSNKCATAQHVPSDIPPAYSFEGETTVANRRFETCATQCCGYADIELECLFTVPYGSHAKACTLVKSAERLAEWYPVLCNSIMRDVLHTVQHPWQVSDGGHGASQTSNICCTCVDAQ